MGDISKLQSGQTFSVTKYSMPQAAKDPSKMTIGELGAFQRENQAELNKLKKVAGEFEARSADNGKVDIMVESDGQLAIVSGKKISLTELGRALPEYALELKKYDENNDNHITEDELTISWGEKLTDAATTVGVSTVSAAGTGAGIGALGGTAVVPGIGTVAGGAGLGLLGGALGFVGSALWEGGSTIMYAMGDGYKKGVPSNIR
jgi:hypothetical protein